MRQNSYERHCSPRRPRRSKSPGLGAGEQPSRQGSPGASLLSPRSLILEGCTVGRGLKVTPSCSVVFPPTEGMFFPCAHLGNKVSRGLCKEVCFLQLWRERRRERRAWGASNILKLDAKITSLKITLPPAQSGQGSSSKHSPSLDTRAWRGLWAVGTSAWLPELRPQLQPGSRRERGREPGVPGPLPPQPPPQARRFCGVSVWPPRGPGPWALLTRDPSPFLPGFPICSRSSWPHTHTPCPPQGCTGTCPGPLGSSAVRLSSSTTIIPAHSRGCRRQSTYVLPKGTGLCLS